ncbi:MAG: alpha/beta hydrolase [Kiritimatiellae bacterium]|nr:alpha/beta hydrolase [Kiritimatiellia bacterium]MDD5522310.1 alpha/beta hydrolase [Kiritimatiellia bacterium]
MIVRISIGVYVGLCLFVFLGQSRYVYYPDRTVDNTPDSAGLEFDNVSVPTQDGETITGWFVPVGKGGGEAGKSLSVLLCHGNGGNIGDRVDQVKIFHNMGFNVLIFDYRGYGTSTGKPTEKGTYYDALAAWNYLKVPKGIESKHIVVFGQSLGGAVASWLAEQVNPGALILESTLTSALDMGARMFPYLPVWLFCTFKYDSLSKMGNIHCPVIVAHSRDDETIPFEHGQKLFKAANEPKLFIEIGGEHNSSGIEFDSSYRTVAVEFLKKNMVNDSAHKTGEKQ